MKKAITVTEQNKALNPRYLGNRGVGSIVVYNQSTFPRVWRTENWTKEAFHLATAFHQQAGFFEVITPNYNASIEKLSAIYFNGDHYTYDVIPKTDEEIQSEIANSAEALRSSQIDQKIRDIFVADLQTENDPETLLSNQELYPLWESGLDVAVGDKYQAFGDNNELWLWQCLKAHTTQSDWLPNVTPALWTRVAHADEYLVWVQPTGAQDAYQTGDIVWFPTEGSTLYQSVINANVWSPIAYPQGWQVYNP